MTVKAIPDGFHTITPFLNIKGAAEAVEFYKKAFGAEVRRVNHAPGGGPIMNAELQIGKSMLRISEAIREAPTQSSLQLYVENAEAMWKRATDAGCEVAMPLATMFWGERWGIVKDKFNNRWAISQRIEELSEAEMQKRAAEFFKNPANRV